MLSCPSGEFAWPAAAGAVGRAGRLRAGAVLPERPGVGRCLGDDRLAAEAAGHQQRGLGVDGCAVGLGRRVGGGGGHVLALRVVRMPHGGSAGGVVGSMWVRNEATVWARCAAGAEPSSVSRRSAGTAASQRLAATLMVARVMG